MACKPEHPAELADEPSAVPHAAACVQCAVPSSTPRQSPRRGL